MPSPRPVSPEFTTLSKAEKAKAKAFADNIMASRVAQGVAKNVVSNCTSRASTPKRERKLSAEETTPEYSTDMPGFCVMTNTESEEAEADSMWMAGLTQSHTGKKLCDYLGHLTSVLDDGNLSVECPIDQAVSFRRVLIRALERKDTPFGLPKKLPRFIAMVQLCGERMLMTTERTQLFQLLAHAPSGARANTDAISAMMQMIKYREEHTDCTLLLTYSAPFQVDLAHLWWDVRTLRRDPETFKVIDGEMAYQIGQSKCRAIGCTSVLESEISTATLEKEVKSFESHISAVDLDMELVSADGPRSSDAPTSKKVEALERVLASLTQERKKMMKEHAEEVTELKCKIKASNEYMEEAARMQHASERDSEESLNREITRLAKEVEASLEAVSGYKAENDHLRKQHRADVNAALMNKNEEIKQLKTKIALLETSGKQATTELSRCNKAREAALKKQEAAQQRSLDEMERKQGKLQMAERAAKQEAEELLVRLNTLSTAMEGRDQEKELLDHQLGQVRTSNKVIKGMLALAANRLIQAQEEVPSDDLLRNQLKAAYEETAELEGTTKTLKLALGANSVEIKELMDLLLNRESERDALNESNARLQQRIDEFEEQVPAPPAPDDGKAGMADAETMTVHITNTADLKIGELETKCVKLRDELDASRSECATTKVEMTRVLARAKKKQPPPGLTVDDAPPALAPAVLGVPSTNGGGYNIVTNVHVGPGGAANTDLGHAPDIDSNVEQLIAQAATGLRVLADMARDSARHKQAACEGWAQARALQSYTGYMPAPQQQQWQQPMHHSPNGYHPM